MQNRRLEVYEISSISALKAQGNILLALMLRDIKSRFFGTAWGFLLAIAWPLSHILLLLLINSALNRLPPYGDSAALWFSTGIVPFMAFSYMSRFIMYGLMHNRPLLVFPSIKIMDIVLASVVIEILNAALVILILIFIFTIMGVDYIPVNVTQAFLAIFSAMALGAGAGIISAILTQAFHGWATGFSLAMVFFWMISGIFFIPDNLPGYLRYPLSFNPILQDVTWLRSAYYEGYGALTLDKFYAVGFAVVCLFAGLVLERLVRGRLLQG